MVLQVVESSYKWRESRTLIAWPQWGMTGTCAETQGRVWLRRWMMFFFMLYCLSVWEDTIDCHSFIVLSSWSHLFLMLHDATPSICRFRRTADVTSGPASKANPPNKKVKPKRSRNHRSLHDFLLMKTTIFRRQKWLRACEASTRVIRATFLGDVHPARLGFPGVMWIQTELPSTNWAYVVNSDVFSMVWRDSFAWRFSSRYCNSCSATSLVQGDYLDLSVKAGLGEDVTTQRILSEKKANKSFGLFWVETCALGTYFFRTEWSSTEISMCLLSFLQLWFLRQQTFRFSRPVTRDQTNSQTLHFPPCRPMLSPMPARPCLTTCHGSD